MRVNFLIFFRLGMRVNFFEMFQVRDESKFFLRCFRLGMRVNFFEMFQVRDESKYF